MEQPDERMWELEISQCDDGDILIEQGQCGNCGEDAIIRLHRCHIPLIAELGGFVPENEVAQAADRLRDRLNLMASLVRAHTKPGDPLRVVVDDLMATVAKTATVAESATVQPPASRDGDLFADRAG